MIPTVAAIAGSRCPAVGRDRGYRPDGVTAPQLGIVPADPDHRRFRQQRMQRAHEFRTQHGLV